MKQAMDGLAFPTSEILETGLKGFRFYYNHLRVHQHLNGKTPCEAWDGKPIVTSKTAKEILYRKGRCGNIHGFYFLE